MEDGMDDSLGLRAEGGVQSLSTILSDLQPPVLTDGATDGDVTEGDVTSRQPTTESGLVVRSSSPRVFMIDGSLGTPEPTTPDLGEPSASVSVSQAYSPEAEGVMTVEGSSMVRAQERYLMDYHEFLPPAKAEAAARYVPPKSEGRNAADLIPLPTSPASVASPGSHAGFDTSVSPALQYRAGGVRGVDPSSLSLADKMAMAASSGIELNRVEKKAVPVMAASPHEVHAQPPPQMRTQVRPVTPKHQSFRRFAPNGVAHRETLPGVETEQVVVMNASPSIHLPDAATNVAAKKKPSLHARTVLRHQEQSPKSKSPGPYSNTVSVIMSDGRMSGPWDAVMHERDDPYIRNSGPYSPDPTGPTEVRPVGANVSVTAPGVEPRAYRAGYNKSTRGGGGWSDGYGEGEPTSDWALQRPGSRGGRVEGSNGRPWSARMPGSPVKNRTVFPSGFNASAAAGGAGGEEGVLIKGRSSMRLVGSSVQTAGVLQVGAKALIRPKNSSVSGGGGVKAGKTKLARPQTSGPRVGSGRGKRPPSAQQGNPFAAGMARSGGSGGKMFEKKEVERRWRQAGPPVPHQFMKSVNELTAWSLTDSGTKGKVKTGKETDRRLTSRCEAACDYMVRVRRQNSAQEGGVCHSVSEDFDDLMAVDPLREVIGRWWTLLPKVPLNDGSRHTNSGNITDSTAFGINQAVYMAYTRIIYKILHVAIDEDDLEYSLEREWVFDTDARSFLDYPRFCRSLLELADAWSIDIDSADDAFLHSSAHPFVVFLESLVELIAAHTGDCPFISQNADVDGTVDAKPQRLKTGAVPQAKQLRKGQVAHYNIGVGTANTTIAIVIRFSRGDLDILAKTGSAPGDAASNDYEWYTRGGGGQARLVCSMQDIPENQRLCVLVAARADTYYHINAVVQPPELPHADLDFDKHKTVTVPAGGATYFKVDMTHAPSSLLRLRSVFKNLEKQHTPSSPPAVRDSKVLTTYDKGTSLGLFVSTTSTHPDHAAFQWTALLPTDLFIHHGGTPAVAGPHTSVSNSRVTDSLVKMGKAQRCFKSTSDIECELDTPDESNVRFSPQAASTAPSPLKDAVRMKGKLFYYIAVVNNSASQCKATISASLFKDAWCLPYTLYPHKYKIASTFWTRYAVNLCRKVPVVIDVSSTRANVDLRIGTVCTHGIKDAAQCSCWKDVTAAENPHDMETAARIETMDGEEIEGLLKRATVWHSRPNGSRHQIILHPVSRAFEGGLVWIGARARKDTPMTIRATMLQPPLELEDNMPMTGEVFELGHYLFYSVPIDEDCDLAVVINCTCEAGAAQVFVSTSNAFPTAEHSRWRSDVLHGHQNLTRRLELADLSQGTPIKSVFIGVGSMDTRPTRFNILTAVMTDEMDEIELHDSRRHKVVVGRDPLLAKFKVWERNSVVMVRVVGGYHDLCLYGHEEPHPNPEHYQWSSRDSMSLVEMASAPSGPQGSLASTPKSSDRLGGPTVTPLATQRSYMNHSLSELSALSVTKLGQRMSGIGGGLGLVGGPQADETIVHTILAYPDQFEDGGDGEPLDLHLSLQTPRVTAPQRRAILMASCIEETPLVLGHTVRWEEEREMTFYAVDVDRDPPSILILVTTDLPTTLYVSDRAPFPRLNSYEWMSSNKRTHMIEISRAYENAQSLNLPLTYYLGIYGQRTVSEVTTSLLDRPRGMSFNSPVQDEVSSIAPHLYTITLPKTGRAPIRMELQWTHKVKPDVGENAETSTKTVSLDGFVHIGTGVAGPGRHLAKTEPQKPTPDLSQSMDVPMVGMTPRSVDVSVMSDTLSNEPLPLRVGASSTIDEFMQDRAGAGTPPPAERHNTPHHTAMDGVTMLEPGATGPPDDSVAVCTIPVRDIDIWADSVSVAVYTRSRVLVPYRLVVYGGKRKINVETKAKTRKPLGYMKMHHDASDAQVLESAIVNRLIKFQTAQLRPPVHLARVADRVIDYYGQNPRGSIDTSRLHEHVDRYLELCFEEDIERETDEAMESLSSPSAGVLPPTDPNSALNLRTRALIDHERKQTGGGELALPARNERASISFPA